MLKGSALAALAALAAQQLPLTTAVSTLILFTDSPDARCLDGSPAGLYLKRAEGANANRWIWWFWGGGWCLSPEDCAVRAAGRLGSSKSWAPTTTWAGILNENATENPDFASWSTAVWGYCDGSSFSSAAGTQEFNATFTLHYNGKAILDAGVAALTAQAGLSDATDVVVTGSSAGGLTTYLHVDHIAEVLPQANVVGMPDAGFFPSAPAFDGTYKWTENYQALVALHNITAADQVNAACFEATPTELLWTCFSAPAFYARISSPLYMLQSVVDWAQLSGWAGLPVTCIDSPLTNCTADQLAFLQGWTISIQGAINNSAAMSPRAYPRSAAASRRVAAVSPRRLAAGALVPPASNGGFFAACIQHEQGYVDRRWSGDSIGGRLMRDSFADWLFSRNGSSASHWRWDVPWPGNPSCQPPGP